MHTSEVLAKLAAVLRDGNWQLASACRRCHGEDCERCRLSEAGSLAVSEYVRWIDHGERLVERLHEAVVALHAHAEANMDDEAWVDLESMASEAHYEYLRWRERREQDSSS